MQLRCWGQQVGYQCGRYRDACGTAQAHTAGGLQRGHKPGAKVRVGAGVWVRVGVGVGAGAGVGVGVRVRVRVRVRVGVRYGLITMGEDKDEGERSGHPATVKNPNRLYKHQPSNLPRTLHSNATSQLAYPQSTHLLAALWPLLLL